MKLQAIQARQDSPPWLAEETSQLRKGLFALFRNRVLLRDPESSSFFPVRTLALSSALHEAAYVLQLISLPAH